MDLIRSGEGISSRNAIGRSGGEKAKARNHQHQVGLRVPRTSTQLQMDEEIASLRKGDGYLAQTLGEFSLYH